MKFRKFNFNEKSSYRYPDSFDNNKYIEITPDDVGAEWIKELYRFDNREVENNLKNARPALNAHERLAKKEWEALHPNEDYPTNWCLSLDAYMENEDGDQFNDGSMMQADLYSSGMYEQTELMIIIAEKVGSFDETDKVIFNLAIMNGVKQRDVAVELSISPAAVNKRYNKILNILKEYLLENGIYF